VASALTRHRREHAGRVAGLAAEPPRPGCPGASDDLAALPREPEGEDLADADPCVVNLGTCPCVTNMPHAFSDGLSSCWSLLVAESVATRPARKWECGEVTDDLTVVVSVGTLTGQTTDLALGQRRSRPSGIRRYERKECRRRCTGNHCAGTGI